MLETARLLDQDAIRLLNRFQGDVPVTSRPFARMAEMLGVTEHAVITTVTTLTAEGWLSRFGPLYDASRFGGAQTLAALEVPEHRFDIVTAQVNALPQVAHNYRREHRLNMWFVLATERPQQIDSTLQEMEKVTGLRVYNFPKLTEYYVGLRLRIAEDGEVDTVPAQCAGTRPGYRPGQLDRKLMVATQRGLPLVSTPYLEIAGRLGVDQDVVLSRFTTLLEHGVIRRIGAVPNHYRLGLRANGMTVWDVADEHIDAVGEAVGQLPFVSHCYKRCRHPGIWPHNLFAMVHGESRSQVESKADAVAQLIGTRCRSRDILYSSAVLKKTGLRLAA